MCVQIVGCFFLHDTDRLPTPPKLSLISSHLPFALWREGGREKPGSPSFHAVPAGNSLLSPLRSLLPSLVKMDELFPRWTSSPLWGRFVRAPAAQEAKSEILGSLGKRKQQNKSKTSTKSLPGLPGASRDLRASGQEFNYPLPCAWSPPLVAPLSHVLVVVLAPPALCRFGPPHSSSLLPLPPQFPPLLLLTPRTPLPPSPSTTITPPHIPPHRTTSHPLGQPCGERRQSQHQTAPQNPLPSARLLSTCSSAISQVCCVSNQPKSALPRDVVSEGRQVPHHAHD